MIVATTAHAPILSPAEVQTPLVISVGADAPLQHELSREQALVADVYVDTIDGFQVGDPRAWSEDRLVQRNQVTDLLCLYRNGPRLGTRPHMLISTGSALFDNLTIWSMLDGVP